MADYGLVVFNASGQEVFGLRTNAARLIGSLVTKVSGSVTDPGFLLGQPWWAYDFGSREFPRPVTITVVGDTLTYSLPTAGLNTRQAANNIFLSFGTR
jgi:hypothetical protein